MINISLRKYMFIDLSILCLIGIVTEIIGVGFVTKYFEKPPVFVFSLLIMTIAITRWRWKGLFIAPFLALATYLSGLLMYDMPSNGVNNYYDYSAYITSLLALLSTSASFLWFKWVGKKHTFQTSELTIAYALVISVIAFGVVFLVQLLFTQQNYIAFIFISNLWGFVLLLIGMLVLKNIGIYIDVKKDLLEKKKEAEYEAAYEKKYQDSLYGIDENGSDKSEDDLKNKEEI